MPIIEPDLSEVQSGAIDPGTWPARCVSIVAETSAKGNPMIVVENEVTYNGKVRNRKDWIVTSGKAAFKFENYLRANGMNAEADQLKAGEKVRIDTDVFLNATYMVVVEADTYNGEPSDKITKYLPM